MRYIDIGGKIDCCGKMVFIIIKFVWGSNGRF